MKKTVKTAICASLLLIILVASTFAMTACDKNDFLADYAKAQENWYSATNKVVYDSMVLDGNLGGEDVEWPIGIELEGYRAYIGDEWHFDYDIVIKTALFEGGGAASINGTLDITRDAEGMVSIVLCANVPIAGELNVNFSISESAIRDYVAVFDFADNVFYDAEKISGTADAYTINGPDSLAYVFYQVAPILSNNFGFDMLPMIESWLTVGDVTGTVTFAGDNFATMTTSQSLSVFAPDADLDFLAYNVDNFPDMLISFFETKSISISGITVNLSKVLTDGIRISADVTSSAEYSLLGDDATFESVAEQYAASQEK